MLIIIMINRQQQEKQNMVARNASEAEVKTVGGNVDCFTKSLFLKGCVQGGEDERGSTTGGYEARHSA